MPILEIPPAILNDREIWIVEDRWNRTQFYSRDLQSDHQRSLATAKLEYSKEFKNKYKKKNCWRNLGEKFNMEPAEAEAIFENIRTAYGYGRYIIEGI